MRVSIETVRLSHLELAEMAALGGSHYKHLNNP